MTINKIVSFNTHARKDMKDALAVLQEISPGVISFFQRKRAEQGESINLKTLENAFKSDGGMHNATFEFFRKFILVSGNLFGYDNLSEDLREYIKNSWGGSSDIKVEFDSALETKRTAPAIDYASIFSDADYIGELQSETLKFHQLDIQKAFFKKLAEAIKKKINHPIQKIEMNGRDSFECSFIDIARQNMPTTGVKISLNNTAAPEKKELTSFIKKANPTNSPDRLSFALTKFVSANDALTLEVGWSTYFKSLENHDAFYMAAIYSYMTPAEDRKIAGLSDNVNRVFEKGGYINCHILGVTTAVIFKRNEEGPYWTFVQLKEGGPSRIAESHLAPSFVHQPVTQMKHSMMKEAEDIEFHIYRELIEEIFNFPEHLHPDFDSYKQLVAEHIAVKSIARLIEQNRAELFCSGLILDLHRAKYELIFILRIDDPSWYAEGARHIQANDEAIPGGVVLAPLNSDGVYQALNGDLTIEKMPIRRMCSPGQAGLVAAIRHLKERRDPHLDGVNVGQL